MFVKSSKLNLAMGNKLDFFNISKQLHFDACIHRKTNPVGLHHSMEGMHRLEFQLCI